MTCNEQFGVRSVIRPDGFTGALFALEGIRDAAVILHGPTGCRSYHAALSEQWYPRETGYEPINFAERFYFGQPRIPTTYLDGDDFVFGAREKLAQAIHRVSEQAPGFLVVINSPGAALIGDDLHHCLTEENLSIPSAVIDWPRASLPMAEGYQQAILTTLEAMRLSARPVQPKTVTLLGLSIAHAHWEGSVEELRSLLGLCGVEVCCVPGAGSAIGDWQKIPSAACHIVLHDEYGGEVGQWLSQRFHAPVVNCGDGAPVGFAATEHWLREVAAATGADPAPALEAIARRRQDVARKLHRVDMFRDALRGARFSICADPSMALPLTQWLYRYLGMIPVAVETPEFFSTLAASRLQSFLREIGCGDAWQRSWRQVETDLLFADGGEVAQARAMRSVAGCVELMLLSETYVDVLPKALLGARGAAYLVEQIVNGLPEL